MNAHLPDVPNDLRLLSFGPVCPGFVLAVVAYPCGPPVARAKRGSDFGSWALLGDVGQAIERSGPDSTIAHITIPIGV